MVVRLQALRILSISISFLFFFLSCGGQGNADISIGLTARLRAGMDTDGSYVAGKVVELRYSSAISLVESEEATALKILVQIGDTAADRDDSQSNSYGAISAESTELVDTTVYVVLEEAVPEGKFWAILIEEGIVTTGESKNTASRLSTSKGVAYRPNPINVEQAVAGTRNIVILVNDALATDHAVDPEKISVYELPNTDTALSGLAIAKSSESDYLVSITFPNDLVADKSYRITFLDNALTDDDASNPEQNTEVSLLATVAAP